MIKNFKDMTQEERQASKQAMLQIPVDGGDVTRFDPMIHKIIKNEVLKYWGNGSNVYVGDAVIGRLGMSFSDLMQYGRMLVVNQIRWFKTHGIDPQTGKPFNAKMTTLIFQHLRNKFMSLSKSFSSDKNGGQVVNTEENRAVLQKFLDSFNCDVNVCDNVVSLQAALKDCSKDLRSRCSKTFTSNREMVKFLRGLLVSFDGVSHVSYEDIESFSAESHGLTPESALLVKEEIQERLKKYCSKNGLEDISLNDFVGRKKRALPRFLPQGKTTILMSLARKRGFQSQRQLAEHFGIGMTTLSNIIRGRSRGTQRFREAVESSFGEKFEKLMEIVDVI